MPKPKWQIKAKCLNAKPAAPREGTRPSPTVMRGGLGAPLPRWERIEVRVK